MIEIAENCGTFFASHYNLNHIFEIIISWVGSYADSLGATTPVPTGSVLNGSIVHLLVEFLVTVSSTSP